MKHRFVLALTLLAPAAVAQALDPVEWSLIPDAASAPPGATVPLRLTAVLEPGWHLYSLTTPKGGPIPTKITFVKNAAVESVDLFQPKPERRFDANFNLDTETFENRVALLITARLKGGPTAGLVELAANVRYQACNDRQCLPPRKKTIGAVIHVAAGALAPGRFALPAGYALVKSDGPAVASATTPRANESYGLFMLTAFGLGLAALFTPCVFPMIPITVSFFLNRRGGILQAGTFSLGIVALFCILGLGITAVVGPFGVVQLGANPWVNGFIAVVFTAFALSLLGAFEITLPSSILTRLDQASRRDNYLGTLLMGLTFSLTSFACVGPFVGSLLAASLQTRGVQPVLGMLSFATGLASPFFILAAFPSYLKRLPKSGGWLMQVKAVMGLVLLAAALKYLSNIDQVMQTGYLTRDRFLAVWFVLFTLAGLYLLGFFRLRGIAGSDSVGVGRFLAASGFLVFAISLLPAMFGSNLGELEAYIPASQSGSVAAASGSGTSLSWLKNQLPEALARARQENKPVLVDFTGYACTNCHWMKANMFNRPEVATEMNDFVLVDLYTDGTDRASETNQEMESSRFKTVALPFYAILGPDGNTISTFSGLTRDPGEWLGFLRKSKGPGA